MKPFFLFALLLYITVSYAGTLIKINSLPANHPFDQPLYLAGSMNNWNPADAIYQLKLNDDQSYSIVLEGTGNVQFKFTRGGWDTVEKGNNCAEIGNRSFTFATDTIYEATIVNWADLCGSNPAVTNTTTDNVSVMDLSFYIPQFDRNRRIWIYLPEDYETSGKSYPVLYMHDGQNLFDAATSFSGEWQVDETLNHLTENGAPASIVVGIDNGGNNRIEEYTPWSNPGYGGGKGNLYAEFLVETLKPYIDAHYRTLSDRENTGVCGSSLGGLISWYIGLKYQDVFSKIGIFSPSFWFSDSTYIMAREIAKQYPMQMYFVAGGQEGSDGEVIDDCEKMISTLKGSGFTDDEMFLNAKADGQHSEWFWRREFPACYQWFWGVKSSKIDSKFIQLEVFPNPANYSIHLQIFSQESFDVVLIDLNGKVVYRNDHVSSGLVIPSQNLPNGTYLVQCKNDKFQVHRKVIVAKTN
ncbi:MAG: alpha/beta hydrolase-fold protein [Prolixibacteraceae bacterium]